MRRVVVALAAGALFGWGLALSGMADPARVRAFLTIGAGWDPTLAFVMAGAIMPMAVAWRVRQRRGGPFAATSFHAPPTTPVTPLLVTGSLVFGVGWGVAGLCPGPALADLALAPDRVWPFVIAMLAGFGLHRVITRRPTRKSTSHPSVAGA